jgi:hypothetical protein
MSGKSTNLVGHLVARILDFNPEGADVPLRGTFTGGLHNLRAPDNAEFPHGTLRLFNRRNADLDDASLEEEGHLEVQLFGRDNKQIVLVERAMDIVEEALLNYHTDQVGVFTLRSLLNRSTMPPFPAPANAEIVHVRAVFRYTWWPTYRTQYAHAAGTPIL